MGRLADDMTRLCDEIGALHSSREAFILNNLKDGVAGMRSGFRNDHADMAGEMKEALAKFVSDLKTNVSEMMTRFNTDHADMAEETTAWRQTFVSGLKDRVSGLCQDFADDIAGARRAWFGPFPAERKKEERKRRVRARRFPDDLTKIKGIGPGRKQALNKAGFHTFAKLAECTPEELQRALMQVGESRLTGVDKWLEQAKKLA
jgi:predicted flap endonuclease-1-like 5' DNA nuclease